MLSLKTRLFAVPYREITFAGRGFQHCQPDVRGRIEEYFASFLDGYHLALRASSQQDLAARLEASFEDELIGFAYEGAGMHLALLDCLTPWRSDRLARFIDGPARHHDLVTLIGAGLAFGRLPWVRASLDTAVSRLDPGLGWLALDGYGFHEGFFHHRRYIERRIPPVLVTGYGARCFDHGLGRSIWFVKGAVPERIRECLAGFPVERQPDLWAGIGLACAYAGGVHPDLGSYAVVLDQLQRFAGPWSAELGLGVVLAAYARLRAGTPSPWTALACHQLAGLSFEAAGRLGERALLDARAALAGASDETIRTYGYEGARQQIRQTLADSVAV